MKKVFISHPYANDPEGNKKKVDRICKRIINKDNNIIPISPLHLFSFMEDDSYRKEILDTCYKLIKFCDELWVYGDSDGCNKEVKFAKKNGVKVFFVKT